MISCGKVLSTRNEMYTAFVFLDGASTALGLTVYLPASLALLTTHVTHTFADDCSYLTYFPIFQISPILYDLFINHLGCWLKKQNL